MSDFPNQVPFARPDLGEEEQVAVLSVLRSGKLVHGAITEAFEEEFARFIGVRHAVAVSNCTSGLLILAMALGRGPSLPRVLVPAMTHVATAMAPHLAGCSLLFADVDPDTGCLDAAAVANTRAPFDLLMVVHFLGVMADMEAICQAAEKRNAIVIEDCALALGASQKGKMAGSIGKAGVFSFYPSKHLCSIEGGMITTDDADLAVRLRQARAFGYDRSLNERLRPGEYDVVSAGGNFRMSEVEAAIGRVQLRRQEDWQRCRRRNTMDLVERLEKIPGLSTIPNSRQMGGADYVSPYCVNVVLDKDLAISRDALMDQLLRSGIGVTKNYPHAVCSLQFFRDWYGFTGEEFPVASHLAARSISLPIGPHVADSDLGRMAEVIIQALS